MSDEAKMSSTAMCNIIGDCMDKAFQKFKPRTQYDIIKIENSKSKKVLHKLTGY